MALKDWKKITNQKYQLIGKGRYGKLWIEKSRSGRYFVSYADRLHTDAKWFETRSQALRFVRAYMRTH